jgi:hypothetical protein
MTAENESASRLVKVMNEDGTDYGCEWKGSETEVFFIQYTLWLNSFTGKMDVIKMDLLTRNKRKICLC